MILKEQITLGETQKLSYTNFLLALCIWREARGESLEGMRNIAHVIRNRAEDESTSWPDDVIAVILQPKQFSSFNNGDPNSTKFPFPEDISWQNAILATKPTSGTYEAYGANHYYAASMKTPPEWAKKAVWKKQVGNHIFLYIPTQAPAFRPAQS